MSRGGFELKILPDVAKESKKMFQGVEFGKKHPNIYIFVPSPQKWISLCDVSQTEIFCVSAEIKVLALVFRGFNAAKSMWLAEQ